MRRVIAISGVARAGKDTFADVFLRVYAGVGVKLPLAGSVRMDVIRHGLATAEEVAEKGPRVRKLLQFYGTDVMRRLDPEYWIHRWCRALVELPPEVELVLVPDVRFPDEMEFFLRTAAAVVYVDAEERLAGELATESFRQHASEAGIPALRARLLATARGDGTRVVLPNNRGEDEFLYSARLLAGVLS